MPGVVVEGGTGVINKGEHQASWFRYKQGGGRESERLNSKQQKNRMRSGVSEFALSAVGIKIVDYFRLKT